MLSGAPAIANVPEQLTVLVIKCVTEFEYKNYFPIKNYFGKGVIFVMYETAKCADQWQSGAQHSIFSTLLLEEDDQLRQVRSQAGVLGKEWQREIVYCHQ